MIRLAKLTKAFRGDESGSYAIILALLAPVIIGFLGLSIDTGLWFSKQALLQAAADSSAFSAAVAKAAGATDVQTQAAGVAATYGFVNTSGGVTLTVNSPPLSGSNTSVTNAVEVIIVQTQVPIFARMFIGPSVPVRARAVAISGTTSLCVLALETAGTGFSLSGSSKIDLSTCSIASNSSNSASLSLSGTSSITAKTVKTVGSIVGQSSITTTSGTYTGAAATPDPYSSQGVPSFIGCLHGLNTATTFNPGVYCSGLSVSGAATVTLQPGIYYIDQGTFSVSGTSRVTGSGVTIVLTSSTGSNYASMSISGSSVVTLTAPTTGATAGFVVLGDKNSPVGPSISLSGSTSGNFTGIVYAKNYSVSYSGTSTNSGACTTLVANTVSLSGATVFSGCATPAASSQTALAE